jgi:hypothetical protein
VLLRLLLLIMLFSYAWAEDHPALPSQVIAAKSVYIDNRSGQAALADDAYQAITAWGRFQVTQDKLQADLILQLSLTKKNRGNNNQGIAIVANYPGVAVLDPGTELILWSESSLASPLRKSAVKRIIDDLRKRIDEQSGAAGKNGKSPQQ